MRLVSWITDVLMIGIMDDDGVSPECISVRNAYSSNVGRGRWRVILEIWCEYQLLYSFELLGYHDRPARICCKIASNAVHGARR
jgi:hypothetical protein